MMTADEKSARPQRPDKVARPQALRLISLAILISPTASAPGGVACSTMATNSEQSVRYRTPSTSG